MSKKSNKRSREETHQPSNDTNFEFRGFVDQKNTKNANALDKLIGETMKKDRKNKRKLREINNKQYGDSMDFSDDSKKENPMIKSMETEIEKRNVDYVSIDNLSSYLDSLKLNDNIQSNMNQSGGSSEGMYLERGETPKELLLNCQLVVPVELNLNKMEFENNESQVLLNNDTIRQNDSKFDKKSLNEYLEDSVRRSIKNALQERDVGDYNLDKVIVQEAFVERCNSSESNVMLGSSLYTNQKNHIDNALKDNYIYKKENNLLEVAKIDGVNDTKGVIFKMNPKTGKKEAEMLFQADQYSDGESDESDTEESNVLDHLSNENNFNYNCKAESDQSTKIEAKYIYFGEPIISNKDNNTNNEINQKFVVKDPAYTEDRCINTFGFLSKDHLNNGIRFFKKNSENDSFCLIPEDLAICDCYKTNCMKLSSRVFYDKEYSDITSKDNVLKINFALFEKVKDILFNLHIKPIPYQNLNNITFNVFILNKNKLNKKKNESYVNENTGKKEDLGKITFNLIVNFAISLKNIPQTMTCIYEHTVKEFKYNIYVKTDNNKTISIDVNDLKKEIEFGHNE